MLQTLMRAATVVLAIAYLVAAIIRLYVGWVARWTRWAYWVSVPACLWLSANQWWTFAQGHPTINSRILFAQIGVMYFLAAVAVFPALVALRRHHETTSDP